MYKIILLTCLTISSVLKAQSFSPGSTDINESVSNEYLNLITSVQSGSGNTDFINQPDLSEFRNMAQSGLESGSTGIKIQNLSCERLTDLSAAVSQSLKSYLTEIYGKDIRQPEDGWTENIVEEFINKQCQIGIVNWEIVDNGKTNYVNSIAIFDKNRNVLFDTKLANFILSSNEISAVAESDNNSSNEVSTIISSGSQTKSRTINVNGTFGSVQLHFVARLKAIVSPYIAASVNDAEYNYFTEYITCERINPTGIPPNADPFLYFGTGGSYALLYNNATPSNSPITISGGTGDRFNEGLYNIYGANGMNWSFSFDFSVDFPGGGIGITPHSNISALSLGAVNNSKINMQNYVYNNNVITGDVRAVFFDNGSLNADNFKVLTGSGAGETGSIRITSKLRAGYMAPNISGTLVPTFFSETSAGFDLSVEYLRGDHVLQPDYELTSTRYNIPIGQIDTLKAKIINKSHAVNLIGGNISIDVSSLNNNLTLLSSATLPIEIIDTSASKEFKFVVRGNSNGIVTPQVNISAMGWDEPVPATILINNITSIDSNIDVSPLIKTLILTAPIQGFYDPALNSMTSDTLRVYLRDAASPFAVIDSAMAYLNSSGEATFAFSKAVNFIQYYIQTKHRNSIETWSKTAQFFINSELNYDFSTAQNQAYGNNMVQIDASPVKYGIYNGDENRDGNVDLADIVNVYNNGLDFVSGYVSSDMNGDNITDLTDLILTHNNSTAFVSKITP